MQQRALNDPYFCFLLGNFVSAKYNLSGAYIPSFQKKEVGSVGQRIQLAPLGGQHTSKIFHLHEANEIICYTCTPLC